MRLFRRYKRAGRDRQGARGQAASMASSTKWTVVTYGSSVHFVRGWPFTSLAYLAQLVRERFFAVYATELIASFTPERLRKVLLYFQLIMAHP